MGGWSNYAENAILDYRLDADLYFGVSTADPGEDGAAVAEPVGGSYARVAITAATWAAASGGSKATSADIIFPEATGSWGTLTHGFVIDSASGAGNFILSGALTTSKTITSGQTLKVTAGSFVVTQE